jgi:hypothetical protein
MVWGSKPTDGGNFILSPEERTELLRAEPNAKRWIRRYTGADEFLNGEERYCLWLIDITPEILRSLPKVLERVNAVREFRAASKAASTRAYAKYPTLFRQIAQPNSDYLLIPLHTSETRRYVPVAFLPSKVIASNACSIIPNATEFHFGVVTSGMHMAWMRHVCGRLESRFRYSGTLVYNNFPWPEVSAAQRERVEAQARAVLAAREPHLPPKGMATLADLYDPLSMPPVLLMAHTELDRAVEKCYRSQPFHSDRERVEFLFSLYEKLTAPLLPAAPKAKARRSPTATGERKLRKGKTPGLYAQKPKHLPQGKSTAESEALAAHFYFMAKEEPLEQERK